MNAIFNRHLSGEISREEARKQAYELAGGKIQTLPWEGTPAGKTIQDGGMSFDDQVDADPSKRKARTMEAEEMQVSVSASTNAIPFIRKMYKAAQKGNEFAQAQLQWLASAGLKEALKGTSARVKFDLATGLYGGYAEPSLAAIVSFKPEDRQVVLEALKQFADNYKQEQVHVRQSTDAALGVKFQDGSYSTPTYRWDLSRALSKQEIQDVIDKSGLYGLTFGDDFVEAYYVGDVTNELARNDFDTAIQSADRLLGAANQGIRREVTRLWAYGDRGDGAIGWPSDSVSATGQEAAKLSTRRDGLGGVHGESGPGARAHAVRVEGTHFSTSPRSSLDGRYFGRGLKGAEQKRLAETTDSRIKERVYFYVNEGKGLTPESGVGGVAHAASIDNLYNIQGDPLKLFKSGDANGSESRVLDAGFDGYYFPNYSSGQGIAIVLGKASRGIAVTATDYDKAAVPVAPAEPYKRALMGAELSKLNMDTLLAAAPSAKLRMGNLTLDAGDVAAARTELAKQGINLPDSTPKFSPSRNTEPFYSALSAEVGALKMQAAPAFGWRDAIQGLVNKGQVKQDEVEWSGLKDWLGLQTGKVTRDQVSQYLDQNGVKVTETTLGASKLNVDKLNEKIEKFDYSAYYNEGDAEVYFVDPDGDVVDFGGLPNNLQDMVQEFEEGTSQPDQAREDYVKKLTGNMASDLRDAPSRYVGQMYEQAKSNADAYNTWKLLQKEQKPVEAKAFMDDHKKAIAGYRSTEAAKKSETLFNNMLRMVERNRDLDPDQKRDRIRVIQAQKEAVAKRAVASQ